LIERATKVGAAGMNVEQVSLTDIQGTERD
jgi:hypothetical protein